METLKKQDSYEGEQDSARQVRDELQSREGPSAQLEQLLTILLSKDQSKNKDEFFKYMTQQAPEVLNKLKTLLWQQEQLQDEQKDLQLLRGCSHVQDDDEEKDNSDEKVEDKSDREIDDYYVSDEEIDYKGTKDYCTRERRKRAAGLTGDYGKQDRLLNYIITNSESLFVPKKIFGSHDWLSSVNESGQRFDTYKTSNTVNYINKNKSVIYLYAIDDSMSREKIDKMIKYCSAFYTGCQIKSLERGQNIPGLKGRKAPMDFLNEYKIKNRMNDGLKQYYVHDIIKSLNTIRPSDAYSVLGMTNHDLYPKESWNFVYGYAYFKPSAGIFSFCRYDPLFEGINDPNREHNILKRSIYCMAHEIGHTFGLKHCVYYECLMNGFMSSEEQKRTSKHILCPVCTKKLQYNIKFDLKPRYEKLIEVCNELGFDREAKTYQNIIAKFKSHGK